MPRVAHGAKNREVEVQVKPEDSFESFFHEHYSRLLGGMLLACGEIHEAEDLAQEAMVRAFENWDRVKRAGNPIGYLYQIGFNALKRRRRLKLHGHLAVEDSPIDPEARATDSALILGALSRLPLAQRQALVLTEWLDIPVDELATLMRVRPATIRTRLHRARAALRTQIEGGGDAGS